MMINNFPLFPDPTKKDKYLFFSNGYFKEKNNPENKSKVLEYSKNIEGWTDELTEMANHHIDINHPIDVESRKKCLGYLEKYELSDKKVILEVGCSSGYLIDEIKKKQKYNYIGSDAVKNQLLKLSNEHINIPFIVFDLLKNPFNKPTVNALIMLNVLEHIKDDNTALLEANKILHKDGILILEVPSGKTLYDDYDKKLMHFRRYNMKDVVDKIENAGFTIEHKTHLGFFIFPIFAIVKLFNKFFKPKDENIVIKQAKISNNFFLRFLFSFERIFSNFSLPFGIRCYICARKK
ncbi:methyltransferase domain-containing protein [Candidatus Pelagibacter sp.]|nr:methyltransferase domain-containing protein [Candidatus Pelagibacter sp.]